MRGLVAICLLGGALWGRGEIIDRVAVTVDKIVITESDVVNQMRIAAFLNSAPLRLTPETKRGAATRLVEQVLIRREMEISRYPAPALAETSGLLEELKAERFPNDDGYQRSLADYGITEQELRENLLLQLTVLRFIEFRFRPGITVTEEEVGQYYREQLLARWGPQNGNPPTLDDSRDQIEDILIEARVSEALDRWLVQAAGQARILYREEAFQ